AALVRSIQVSAALDRILQLCVDHAAARVQFGRPLAKFQAVQNLISDIAAEAALARAATEAALHAGVIGQWSAARASAASAAISEIRFCTAWNLARGRPNWTRAATEAALHAGVIGQWSAPHLEFLVAVARSCVGHATSVVVRNAHQ
ncbi:acyl-CoA dehydrogenase family protein, partial [Mycobacterium paraintracellulare]|uniref:acyl-CoA dehydrogenase family protein n=1 Tax=Mycobacterium paraintracellulare TaxID=1138383 RepID=UPI0022AA1242